MSKFIRAALNNENITVYGDGSQTRTFCYINDNIDACINALEKNLFINDVVNIGNDKETTILELAKEIIKATNSSSQIVHLPALEEGDMTRRLPDITNMKTLLDRELMSMSDGIQKVVKSIKTV